MRILMADDDPEIANFVKRGLVCKGYDVETAADGDFHRGRVSRKVGL